MILTQIVADKLRELPDAPGVYQMKDRRGKILYIGKALNLKNRVSTYFQSGAENDPRIAQLVTRIEDLDWIIVPSEMDALILESSLIRQFKPFYNTSLKDDKSYPYIKITTGEPYPRVMITRRYLADKAKYWGPMTNVMAVRAAVKFIAGLFQLRTCKLELDGAKFMQKPCLDYHLKLCSGPCVDYIKREEYRKTVRYAIEFFNGHYGRVLAELKRRMAERAEKRDYESAARYRDLIGAVENSFARTRMIGAPHENMDIVGVARSKDKACVLIMPVRDGRLVGDHKYILNHRLSDSAVEGRKSKVEFDDSGNAQVPGEFDHRPATSDTSEVENDDLVAALIPTEAEQIDDVLAGFIKLHYANPLNIPPRIVLPYEPPDAALLASWLGQIKAASDADIEAVGTRATDEVLKAKPVDSRKSKVEGEGEAVESRKSVLGDGLDDAEGLTSADSDLRPSTSDQPETEPADAPAVRKKTKVKKPVPVAQVVFEIPKSGQHYELLQVASSNAAERLHTELLGVRDDFVVSPGQQALAEHLGLAEAPRRVEGYDIANLQGKQATGAMVVNIGGRKAPREYRLFNIRLKDTPDDFAMLRETLSRRLTRLLSDSKWDTEVDVIMLDGGKGQLSSGREVLETMQADPRFSPEQRERLARIKLCSLAKQEELVYHYPGQFGMARLELDPTGSVGAGLDPPGFVGPGLVPGQPPRYEEGGDKPTPLQDQVEPRAETPVPLEEGGSRPAPTGWGPVQELRLPRTDPGLRLLVGLRDEAHRYGNAQHALLREKAMKLSVLDTIPGVGQVRQQALIKHFGSVKRLREASEEELAAAPGVGPKLAGALRKYLDRDEQLEEIKAETRREMKIRRIKRHNEFTKE
ncbi:excinuclease ABC subunit C [bacterium]|nr:excinuclease ABC subunit C [bacterium]